MSGLSRQRYVREILDRYRKTPGTRGRVRPPDRRLAEDLYRRGISIQLVRAALLLAAGRRTLRNPDLGPLKPIGSLHYLLPVLAEIQRQPVDPRYLHNTSKPDSPSPPATIDLRDHNTIEYRDASQ